jgi:hypothetical protein
MGMPISSAGAHSAVVSQPVKAHPAPAPAAAAAPAAPAALALATSGSIGTRVNTTA